MPTKHPRVYIPVSDDLRAALDEFTKVSGVAKSQILSQLLSETAPVIRAMTEAFRLAKKSPAQAADAMRDVVHGAHVQIAQLQLDMQPKPKRKKLRKSPKRD